jgi:hypothetical protein
MTVTSSISILLGEAAPGISGWHESDIIAALLILVLGVALGIGFVCLLLVMHYLRGGRLAARRAWPPIFEMPERRLPCSIFSLPSRWLAIKSGNPYVVQAALGLHRPTPCSWEEGLSVTNEKKLFVSPPINGWVLVMGAHLPDPSEDVDQCFQFLIGLSRKLGHVQYFSTNRVVNHHAWVQVHQGVVHRAYAWIGRTVWNQGRKTAAEGTLGMHCFDYGEEAERVRFGQNRSASTEHRARFPAGGALERRSRRRGRPALERISRLDRRNLAVQSALDVQIEQEQTERTEDLEKIRRSIFLFQRCKSSRCLKLKSLFSLLTSCSTGIDAE